MIQYVYAALGLFYGLGIAVKHLSPIFLIGGVLILFSEVMVVVLVLGAIAAIAKAGDVSYEYYRLQQ